MRGGGVAVVVVALQTVLQLALVGPALADEGEARKAMARGVAALAAGDASNALVEFQAAQKLVPNAPVPYRYAGRALEALGRWTEAIDSYHTYLRIRPLSKDASELRKRIESIRLRHLEGVVDVICSPEGVPILVDDGDQSVGVTPLRGLHLTKGAHRLTLRASGYVSKVLSVTVSAGATVQLQCELAPAPPKIVPPAVIVTPAPVLPRRDLTAPPPRRDAPSARPWYKRTWVWGVVGTALVAGGVSLYLTRPSFPSTVGGEVYFP